MDQVEFWNFQIFISEKECWNNWKLWNIRNIWNFKYFCGIDLAGISVISGILEFLIFRDVIYPKIHIEILRLIVQELAQSDLLLLS